MNEKLQLFLESHGINYETEVSLKSKTWIRRGGIANIYIVPVGGGQLLLTCQYLYRNGLKFLILGHTSNTYILNTKNIDIVISTKCCRNYELKDNKIYCEAGVSVVRLARDMINKGISGFEYLTDLPGTVGAAVYNNSSCRHNSISDLLVSADVLQPNGELISMSPQEMCFKYRDSVFKSKLKDGIIVRVILKAVCGDVKELQSIAKANKLDREKMLEGHKQNLGCTVNNLAKGCMPKRYKVLLKLYNLYLKCFVHKDIPIEKLNKDFLCKISGYKDLAPYISDKEISIFVWRDSNADEMFEKYLEFLSKVYKTYRVEIEVIK